MIVSYTYLKINLFLKANLNIQEETQFRMIRSEYPQLEAVKNGLDPFTRLFSTVSKWQRNEKKVCFAFFYDFGHKEYSVLNIYF